VVARGLDIPNVHCIINFSFPTEPKRYIHRIGRTARAGQHGVAITLCNEEERKDLKKLSRKLNQNVSTFSIQPKFLNNHFELIKTKLDRVVRDIQNEVIQDREMKETMRDLLKSENMIKYKNEIETRPKKLWFMGQSKKDNIK
jgi:ATP-dependent RNA helicase DDX27